MFAPDYPAVLAALYPDAEWTLNGDSYDGLTWLSEGDAPSQEMLDGAWPQVEYDREVAQVRAARAVRYAAETDPMYWKVMRAEDGLSLQDWVDAVEQIRVDLPYPEPV